MAAKSKKNVSEVPDKSSTTRGPAFETAAGGSAVRVTPGAGGHNLGTPTYCESKRAAGNVKSY